MQHNMEQKYLVQLEGEDHTQFAIEVSAFDEEGAYIVVDQMYPEARILDISSEAQRQRDAMRRCMRLLHEMEDELDLTGDCWL